MTELFPNVPNFARELANFWIDMAAKESNMLKAMDILKKHRDDMPDDESKEYYDFVIQCKFEQLTNQ